MSAGDDGLEFMGMDAPMISSYESKGFTPIMSKFKIIPIKSALMRQLEERQNNMLVSEQKAAKNLNDKQV